MFVIFKETIWKKFFCKIEAKLEQKINQSELEKIKDSLELQLKTIKVKQPEPAMPEDGAAGFRKPILRNFHCISCDRPLDMVQDDAVPTLPICQALPGNRAIRPYTTFELEQIRKHVRGTGSNKGRFELAQEREKLQRQLLRLWFVRIFTTDILQIMNLSSSNFFYGVNVFYNKLLVDSYGIYFEIDF